MDTTHTASRSTANRTMRFGAWGSLVCLTVFMVDTGLAAYPMSPVTVATLISFVIIAVVCLLTLLMREITGRSETAEEKHGKKLIAMEWIVWLTVFMAVANLAHFVLTPKYVIAIVIVALVSSFGYYWLKSHRASRSSHK
jgi:Na+/H+ antiporter NhaD/arsenite permease-like protein